MLSNERTRTTWAHPRYPAEILGGAQRPAPGGSSRLRRRTEDGFKEVYVVLRDRAERPLAEGPHPRAARTAAGAGCAAAGSGGCGW